MHQSSKVPVAHFDIYFTRYLDSEGNLVQPLPAFAKDTSELLALYTGMVKNRVFDTKAITLQRTGKLGTYPSSLGQEAIGIGMGTVMRAEDVFCPYYREQGAQFSRGVKMVDILRYWGGDERGSNFEAPCHDFPICVPIASQTLHAAGIALAMKLRHEPRVTVVCVGDGGTSRGDFYEAINLAGVAKLPLVFVINNNQWAISMPRSSQTAAVTLAQKGIAGGLRSEQVDGNDVIAVRQVVGEAIARARNDEGATLIEALSYRMSDHTTADDAKRYRQMEELLKHATEDPILRLKKYLIKNGLWDDSKESQLQEEANQLVMDAVREYEQTPLKSPESMFDYLYAHLPLAYEWQRAEVASLKKQDASHD